MCGICGFISNRPVSPEQLKRMNDTMTHRGPDDSGEEIISVGRDLFLGMAHKRLSILDLSKNGHQPFHSQNNDVLVVFNGEIYNFENLKEELSEYPFISRCDTEVIIAAYERWGERFVDHIDGMFAIALYDKRIDKLFLVRDRIGKKPLYYYYDKGNLVFASTLQPIMQYPGFCRDINTEVIPGYLYNRYLAYEESIFRGVKRIRPGQMLIFDPERSVKKTYWSYAEEYKKRKSNPIKEYAEAKEQLRIDLKASVKSRLAADVPVGAFLSGGIDSSLVTAVAQETAGFQIKTFSIGFEDRDYDESPYAEAVAGHLGTDHTTHYVTEHEMLQLVESIPRFYDEPFADPSQIPTMMVSEIAAKDVKVVLTGDGGDELFCGYIIYELLAKAQRLEPVAKILRPAAGHSERLLNNLPYSVRAILQNDDARYKTQFGRRGYENSISRMLHCDRTAVLYDESAIPEKNWVIRRMLLDGTTYLCDNNLCKVDRATMKHSLEARSPLLDAVLVEDVFRIPLKYKYKQGKQKYILRDLAYDYVPRELLDRPKMGFSVPIDKWLRGPLKDELLEVTGVSYLRRQGLFDPVYTAEYVRGYLQKGDMGTFSGQNASNIVWPLYMFQKWYQYYMA